MSAIERWLGSILGKLSDQNYERSLASYRFWFEIGHTHSNIRSDRILDDIWANKGSRAVSPKDGKLFHPTAHLIPRFVNDAEADCILGPHSPGLRRRFIARILQSFFENNVSGALERDKEERWQSLSTLESIDSQGALYSNLVAWWTNSGHVEQATIRDRILQSLISDPNLYDHQADALIILFKMAGATFEAYVEPSVVDRCIELLGKHYSPNTIKHNLAQVRVPCTEKGVI